MPEFKTYKQAKLFDVVNDIYVYIDYTLQTVVKNVTSFLDDTKKTLKNSISLKSIKTYDDYKKELENFAGKADELVQICREIYKSNIDGWFKLELNEFAIGLLNK